MGFSMFFGRFLRADEDRCNWNENDNLSQSRGYVLIAVKCSDMEDKYLDKNYVAPAAALKKLRRQEVWNRRYTSMEPPGTARRNL